jgi:hypothetical protein
MKLCIFFTAVMLSSAAAETLNYWLAEQVQRDEQKLKDGLNQTNGYDIKLLKYAKMYVPFFAEAPENFDFQSISLQQKSEFDGWLSREHGSGFLPGGYIYRLKFKTAPPLYAMSAGDWEVEKWHSLALDKDLRIESGNTWESSKSGYFYTTLIGGVEPQIISYNQSGEVAHQETFDANALDFEQRLQGAIALYASREKPILEMIPLAEYLNQPDTTWRAVDATGRFNLRNQQQRPDEQERLKQIGQLTRSAAIKGLISGTTEAQNTATPKPSTIVETPAPEAKPTSVFSAKSPSSRLWGLIAVMIVAMSGLLWLLLKQRL